MLWRMAQAMMTFLAHLYWALWVFSMGDCPDLRKPGVEFCLGRVNKGLSVVVWIHENVADEVPCVPCQKEVPLPLNHRLHVGVFPNLGFMVGALPVCVAVQDQVFVISKNLNVMLSIRYIMIFFIYFSGIRIRILLSK